MVSRQMCKGKWIVCLVLGRGWETAFSRDVVQSLYKTLRNATDVH
jgi:hypothetical protein